MAEEASEATQEKEPELSIGEQARAEARTELKLDLPDPNEGTDETETESEAPEGEQVEDETPVDWSDEEQRTAELKRITDGFDERMTNQKRSLTGSFEAERQQLRGQLASEADTALLRELDALEPEEYKVRTDTDAAAASAVKRRTDRQQASPEIRQTVAMEVVAKQTVQMFGARPELEGFAATGGDEWKEATSGEHGVFGYINRTALAEGETAGVEKFKKSKAFRELITEAEQRGKQNAFTESGLGGPPPSNGSTPTQPGNVEYDDIGQQAAEEARREMIAAGKTPPAIDISALTRRRRAG